jgi:AraC-like DNA-binding protein
MSRTRQDKPRLLVRTFGVTFFSAQTFSYTAGGWDQLIYAVKGVVTVRSARDAWVLPAQRALWVPNGVKADIEIPGPVSLRSLYFREKLVSSLPRKCEVVNVSPLLRELILETMRFGILHGNVARERNIARVLADQLKSVRSVPLQLPTPHDPRAQRAVALMLAEPASGAVDALAKRAGASVRTLERLFRAETSMPLAAWRRRMRVLTALRLLAAGESVTQVALAVGYDSISAFVAMFRRELGVTPARYFS